MTYAERVAPKVFVETVRNLYCGVNVGLKFTHTRAWRVGAWPKRIPGRKGKQGLSE